MVRHSDPCLECRSSQRRLAGCVLTGGGFFFCCFHVADHLSRRLLNGVKLDRILRDPGDPQRWNVQNQRRPEESRRVRQSGSDRPGTSISMERKECCGCRLGETSRDFLSMMLNLPSSTATLTAGGPCCHVLFGVSSVSGTAG